jgi:hypothetical protein
MERKTARNWNWARPTIQFFRAYGVGGGGDVEVEVRTDLCLSRFELACFMHCVTHRVAVRKEADFVSRHY